MFDEGRAERAFAAIATVVGHPMRVGDVHITPDAFSVTIASDDKPGQGESGRFLRRAWPARPAWMSPSSSTRGMYSSRTA